MSTNLVIVAALILIVGLLLVIWGQSKEIKMLNQQKKKYMPKANETELKAVTAEKLQTLGIIKTVDYLRAEKGLSMVEAKHLVDQLKQ